LKHELLTREEAAKCGLNKQNLAQEIETLRYHDDDLIATLLEQTESRSRD